MAGQNVTYLPFKTDKTERSHRTLVRNINRLT